MSLGKTPTQTVMFASGTDFCEKRLGESSVYRLLHRECHRLFPDELFSDLFVDTGRRSVPPRIVAVVMVLQRLEGLSDRDAVERFAFDLRWKYAAGGLEFPIRVSCTRYWWTCGPGCGLPSAPIGFSRRCWR